MNADEARLPPIRRGALNMATELRWAIEWSSCVEP